MARKTRFTVYDMLDEKGTFEKNPANACSPDYKGPIKFPTMLYHPKGETRVTSRAEEVRTPSGSQFVGEQRELIHTVAHDQDEKDRLMAEGWWDHPAKAIAASGREAPPTAQALEDPRDAQIRELLAQNAALREAAKDPYGIAPPKAGKAAA